MVESRECSRFENMNPFQAIEDSDENEELSKVCHMCLDQSGYQPEGEPWMIMGPRGTKRIQAVETPENKIPMSLTFQVTSVNKPLLSVKRVTEKGNHVSFGPKPEDNFIVNKKTGDKIALRSNGKGSFLMDVNFENGGKISITLDSGAEESVCPKEWGSQFGLKAADMWLNFKGANGSKIDHFGQRSVRVFSPFIR